jgi:tetratricopeptide (TPR) repeat protein
MDCRRTLLLSLGLLVCAAAGCVFKKSQSVLPTPESLAMEEVGRERKLPKRPPHASTCVAYGDFARQEADSTTRTPVEQDFMREQARKAYQQALEIDPKNLQASRALAQLYDARGDHERAVATYQKALKAHPKEAMLWSELGMSHARQKEWEPALKCLRKGLQLDPENRQLALNLGHCLARAGRYEDSLACFQKVVGPAKAHYNLARMLHHLQQNDLSMQHVQLALREDPQLVPAQQLLAHLEGRPVPPDEEPTQQASHEEESNP